jgi:NADH:ubiquinone oxidoreductase subunit F (NADH-binding)
VALEQARAWGLIGPYVLGTTFSLEVEIRRGAGGFVLGEETALLESIEGQRAMPRTRPPFPVESGLFGKPTVINNVETLSAVPSIV